MSKTLVLSGVFSLLLPGKYSILKNGKNIEKSVLGGKMIKHNVLQDELSLLGFGTMRLPLLENGAIDEVQVEKMVDYAMEYGVNFF